MCIRVYINVLGRFNFPHPSFSFFGHEYKVLWVILLLQQYVNQSEE